ncbi:hypothetical protein HOY82DRAFT_542468 [Tuber indicum]|nr:hypothetical protein HOY82DRAFT_542468 [Tuber indicum]
MQIKHYPLLLVRPALTTLAAPSPTGHLSQQQQATSQTVSMPAPIGQNPTPTPLPPSIMGGPPSPSPAKPTRQQPPQELKLQLRSHDGTEISSIPAASCEQTTPTSSESTDVQALSKHYQS